MKNPHAQGTYQYHQWEADRATRRALIAATVAVTFALLAVVAMVVSLMTD